MAALLTNKYFQIAAGFFIAVVIFVVGVGAWKSKIIRDYEATKQAEVKEQVQNDEKQIKDTFDNDNAAINDSVERMLESDCESRLQRLKGNTAYAHGFSEEHTDMGAQDRLRYLQTEKSEVPDLLCSVEQVINCKPKKCCG